MKVFNHIYSDKGSLKKFTKNNNICDNSNTILQIFYKKSNVTIFNTIKKIIKQEFPKIKIIKTPSSSIKNDKTILSFIVLGNKTKYKKELKKINTLLDQYKNVVDYNSIISKTDLKGKITYANEKFCKVCGYTKQELIGKNHNIVRSKDTPKDIYKELWDTIQKKQTWQGILKNRTKNGENYYVESTVMPILDEKGEICEYIALRHNITEIMNPKRRLIEKIKVIEEPMLVMIKIDGYEILEDFYDQESVETIEDSLSLQILDFFPKECRFDKVYQFGNGEFGFLKDMKNNPITLQEQHKHLKKFQDNISDAKVILKDYEYDINIIISFATGKRDIFENVIYGLKKAQKDKLDIVFANDLIEQKQKQAIHNINMIKMVKNALVDKRIVSYYQPIFCNKSNKIKKYESLVRLIDEDKNVITPYHFIDLSKKGKYYSQITNTVLDQAFVLLDKTECDVSINISMLDIENGYIRNKIINLLKLNATKAKRVVFELLEDENAKDYKLVFDFISLIKGLGAKIAIDDFGAGYSNFNRLLEFQPDILKIDGSLIKNIEKDVFSKNVVETIQAFAVKQNIETVAEFVSSKNILNIVNQIGIDYSQGYYIGKPENKF